MLTIGVLGWIATVAWEIRRKDPVIDFRLLASRNFAIANALFFVFGFGLFGSTTLPTATTWAWSPRDAADGRVWRASVNGRLLLYPVEPTAAGAIPHDAFVRGSETESIGSAPRHLLTRVNLPFGHSIIAIARPAS